MWSFEVSVRLLFSFHLSHERNPCYRSFMKIHQQGAKIFKKMCSFEVSIGLLPSFQLSDQKNPCYRSFMKIHQQGAKIFKKMCSFEVSIGLLPLYFICLMKRMPVIEVLCKSVNMKPRYLTECAVLKLA